MSKQVCIHLESCCEPVGQRGSGILMIQNIQRKREAKDQPEHERSIRELPICGFHGEKSIASSVQCKVISGDRKSTRLNSSHVAISYAVFCLKKKRKM